MDLDDQIAKLLKDAHERRERSLRRAEEARRRAEEAQREVEALEVTQALLLRSRGQEVPVPRSDQPGLERVVPPSFEGGGVQARDFLGFVTTDTVRGPAPEQGTDEAQEANGASQDETEQRQMWRHVPSHVNRPTATFSLGREVRRAVKELEGQTFVQKHVTEMLREQHPNATVYPGSVSAALARMAELGELVVVKPAGGGSDPAVYREAPVSP